MGATLAATFVDDCHVSLLFLIFSIFNNSSLKVVLMKCHGMVVRGESIRHAVFRSFYTKENATIQLKSTLLGGGRQPIGLSPREALDAMKTNESSKMYDIQFSLISCLFMIY